MSSIKDDIVEKIIIDEIYRKKKKKIQDIITTFKNSEDNECTQLLNQLVSNRKKKKRKKAEIVQVNHENVSTAAENDKVKAVEILVYTNVPKKEKKKKQQTSYNVGGRDLENDDVIMPNVKEVINATLKNSEINKQHSFLKTKHIKKKKKKKKKFCDLSKYELINTILSKTQENIKETLNSLNNSEDIMKNTFLLNKMKKKKRKKDEKVHDISDDAFACVEVDNLITDVTTEPKKSKKKKIRDQSKNDLEMDDVVFPKAPKADKIPISVDNTLTNSEDNVKSTPLIQTKSKKKKKKKNTEVEIHNSSFPKKLKGKKGETLSFIRNNVLKADFATKQKVQKINKVSEIQDSTLTSLEDNLRCEYSYLLKKNKKKKNTEVKTNVSTVLKKLKKKKRLSPCHESDNDLKTNDVITQKVPIGLMSTTDSEDNMESTILDLLNEMKKKKRKKRKRKKNDKVQGTSHDVFTCVEIEKLKTDVTTEPKKSKKKKRQRVKSTSLFQTEEKKKKNSEERINGTRGEVKLPPEEGCTMDLTYRRKTERNENLSVDVRVTDTTSRVLEVFECDADDGKSFRGVSSAQEETKTPTQEPAEENGRFKCDVCDRTFVWKSNLVRHYKTHTGERSWACELCETKFTRKSNLDEHYRTHTGEKSYACNVCGKKFAQNSNLVVHYRTHSGEKPYSCDVCGKTFFLNSTLVKHYRTHTGENPYECDVCRKTFTQRSNMMVHRRIHKGEKPYKCGLCDKSFANSSGRNTHTSRMHKTLDMVNK